MLLLSTLVFQVAPGGCASEPPVRQPAPYALSYELSLDSTGKQVSGIPSSIVFRAASGHELSHTVQQDPATGARVNVRGWDPVKLDGAVVADPSAFVKWRDQVATLSRCTDGTTTCDLDAQWTSSSPPVTLDGTLTALTEDGSWLFRYHFSEAWPSSVTALPGDLASLTLVTRLGSMELNPDHPFVTELKRCYQVSVDASSRLVVTDSTGMDIHELSASALGIDELLAGFDRAFASPACPTERVASSGDYLPAHNWKIEIDGVISGGFRQVDGLEPELEVIEYKDGSDPITHKRAGKAKYKNIVLKRGFTFDTTLFSSYKSNLSGTTDRKSGSIIYLDRAGNEVLRYNFFEAWPCRWKAPELNSSSDSHAIEKIEIAVEKVERA